MGQKAAEMLRLIPEADVKVIERCSGHGGSWGFKKEYFEVALKVGRPVARQAAQNGAGYRYVGMPAGRRAHRAGHREAWQRRRPKPAIGDPSDPVAGARLWARRVNGEIAMAKHALR